MKFIQRIFKDFGGGESDPEALKFWNAVQGFKGWQSRVEEKGVIRSQYLWLPSLAAITSRIERGSAGLV